MKQRFTAEDFEADVEICGMTPFVAKETMNRRLQVAVSVEHSRGWGRRVCEGICSYAQTHPNWRITMFDGVLPSVGDLKAFDGFLWSVSDARTAKRLLYSSDLPLSDVAKQAGFHTQQYFCLCFRRETGMAPGAFRERVGRRG